MHYCSYHKTKEPEGNFRVKNGKLDSWCIEGRREYNRQYSKDQYAPRKEEVALEKQKREQRTSQICTSCEKEKSIEEFAFRSDRPGKRHARCKVCRGEEQRDRSYLYNIGNRDSIRENKRDYRERNRDLIRGHSRKRRARKRGVRREAYTEQQIRERDGNLCYFCKEYVDPSIPYPKPKSQVLHHVHPLSKRGPDIAANVFLAHSECNNRQHNIHISPFTEGWSVRPISNKLARDIAKEKHYLHRTPNSSFAFGLFSPDDFEPKGIVIFGTPSSNRISKSICPSNVKLVIELNRLWIDDDAPFGAASWFVSRALKALPPRIVVSYADTAIKDSRDGRAHDGKVYQALSFFYAGKSSPRKEWRMPGSSRNSGKVPGAEQCEVSAKERYWTVTGTKRDKAALFALSQWPAL